MFRSLFPALLLLAAPTAGLAQRAPDDSPIAAPAEASPPTAADQLHFPLFPVLGGGSETLAFLSRPTVVYYPGTTDLENPRLLRLVETLGWAVELRPGWDAVVVLPEALEDDLALEVFVWSNALDRSPLHWTWLEPLPRAQQEASGRLGAALGLPRPAPGLEGLLLVAGLPWRSPFGRRAAGLDAQLLGTDIDRLGSALDEQLERLLEDGPGEEDDEAGAERTQANRWILERDYARASNLSDALEKRQKQLQRTQERERKESPYGFASAADSIAVSLTQVQISMQTGCELGRCAALIDAGHLASGKRLLEQLRQERLGRWDSLDDALKELERDLRKKSRRVELERAEALEALRQAAGETGLPAQIPALEQFLEANPSGATAKRATRLLEVARRVAELEASASPAQGPAGGGAADGETEQE